MNDWSRDMFIDVPELSPAPGELEVFGATPPAAVRPAWVGADDAPLLGRRPCAKPAAQAVS